MRAPYRVKKGKTDKAAMSHKIDQLDLMGQFAWRDGQRHPLEFLVDSDALTLPAGAVREGKGDFRCALFLRAAKQMSPADGRLFRVEAQDNDGELWYGIIDLATKQGFLSKGPHPVREE